MEISSRPDPLVDRLYPDVTEHGSLSDLLTHLGVQLKLELEVEDGAFEGRSAFIRGQYGKSQVRLGANERCFSFDFWRKGVILANGRTDSPQKMLLPLHEMLEKGVSPLELTSDFAYVTPHENAEAFYRGPQFQVQAQWDGLERLFKDDDSFMGYLYPLIRLARQHPRLGQLFPYTSMWSLCFSSCTGYPFDEPCPSIVVVRDEDSPHPYIVGDWNRDGANVVFRGDAREALEFVAAQLPPDCGPAHQGTAEDE